MTAVEKTRTSANLYVRPSYIFGTSQAADAEGLDTHLRYLFQEPPVLPRVHVDRGVGEKPKLRELVMHVV